MLDQSVQFGYDRLASEKDEAGIGTPEWSGVGGVRLSDFARLVGVSPSVLHGQIKRLGEEGVLTRYGYK